MQLSRRKLAIALSAVYLFFVKNNFARTARNRRDRDRPLKMRKIHWSLLLLASIECAAGQLQPLPWIKVVAAHAWAGPACGCKCGCGW